MPEYIPSPRDWVREQVELYEKSGGTQGTTLRDTGLPCIIVTHTGNKTGAIRAAHGAGGTTSPSRDAVLPRQARHCEDLGYLIRI